MPSGISGLYRLLSNGFVGFTMIDRAWTWDGPASALMGCMMTSYTLVLADVSRTTQ